jgi:predicted DNA-binding protein
MSELPQRPEDMRDFMNNLAFSDEPAELPPPPGPEETMVVRSLRLPLGLDRRLKAAAAARGVAMSTLLREWIELELAVLEHDRPISRADALRALATLRPVDGVA